MVIIYYCVNKNDCQGIWLKVKEKQQFRGKKKEQLLQ
jgi:hypothetical protein